MSLFEQIASAIANPQQQASPDQMGTILSVVQQLAGNHGMESMATQAVMSALTGHLQSSLQGQQAAGGVEQVAALLGQFAGTSPNASAVNALFPGQQQQDVAQSIAQSTGIDMSTIQSLLPALIPVALNMLQSGASTQPTAGANPVLNAFLDSDHNGSVDLGDALSMASQFLAR
jgi:flagellar motor switch protein FliG